TAWSANGVTWTPVTGPSEQTLLDVQYIGSQFVVVGDRATVATSPDCVTWTDHSPGFPAGFAVAVLQKVAAGNGVMVAVGNKRVTTTSVVSPWIVRSM